VLKWCQWKSWASSASCCMLDIDLFVWCILFGTGEPSFTDKVYKKKLTFVISSMLSSPHAPLLNRTMDMRGGQILMLDSALLSPAVFLTCYHENTRWSAYLSPKSGIGWVAWGRVLGRKMGNCSSLWLDCFASMATVSFLVEKSWCPGNIVDLQFF